MKTLVVFDSYFGNTQKVAEAIGANLEGAAVVKVSELTGEETFDQLVVGSPTRGFRPTKATMDFLRGADLKGKSVMVFDTRILIGDTDNRMLKQMIRWFGYGAEKMAKKAIRSGAEVVGKPEGFAVQDTEGPLKEGELERAVKWSGGFR